MMCGVDGCYFLGGSGVFSQCALESGLCLQKDTHTQPGCHHVHVHLACEPKKLRGRRFFEPPSVRPREIGNGTCVGLPVSVETSWTEGAILNPTWTYFSL